MLKLGCLRKLGTKEKEWKKLGTAAAQEEKNATQTLGHVSTMEKIVNYSLHFLLQSFVVAWQGIQEKKTKVCYLWMPRLKEKKVVVGNLLGPSIELAW